MFDDGLWDVFSQYVEIQRERDTKNLGFYLHPEDSGQINSSYFVNGKYLDVTSFADRVSSVVNDGGAVFGTAQGRSGIEVKRYLEQLSLYGINTHFEGDTNQKTLREKDIVIGGTGSGTTDQTLMDINAAKAAGATIIVITADETADATSMIRDYKKGYFVKIPAKTKKSDITDYVERQIRGRSFDDLSPMGTDFERKIQLYLDAQIPNIVHRLDTDRFSIYSDIGEYDILLRLNGGADKINDGLFETTYKYYLENAKVLSDSTNTETLESAAETIMNHMNPRDLVSGGEKHSKVLVAGKHSARAIAMRLMHLGAKCQMVGEATTGPLVKGDLGFVVSTSGNSMNGRILSETAIKCETPLVSIVANPGDCVDSEIANIHSTNGNHAVLHVVPISGDPFEYQTPESGSEFMVFDNSRGDLRPQQNMTLCLDSLVAVLSYVIGADERSMKGRHADN